MKYRRGKARTWRTKGGISFKGKKKSQPRVSVNTEAGSGAGKEKTIGRGEMFSLYIKRRK